VRSAQVPRDTHVAPPGRRLAGYARCSPNGWVLRPGYPERANWGSVVEVKLVGVREFELAIEGRIRAVVDATRSGITESLHLVEREAKLNLRTSSHRPGEPTPSEPGDPPSKVTGQLARSVRVEAARQLYPGRWVGRVGPTIIYGRIQELGGQTGRAGATTLPARPYLTPAYARVVPIRFAVIMRARWAAAHTTGAGGGPGG
jgi:hypothetical protein